MWLEYANKQNVTYINFNKINYIEVNPDFIKIIFDGGNVVIFKQGNEKLYLVIKEFLSKRCGKSIYLSGSNEWIFTGEL